MGNFPPTWADQEKHRILKEEKKHFISKHKQTQPTPEELEFLRICFKRPVPQFNATPRPSLLKPTPLQMEEFEPVIRNSHAPL